MKGGRNVRSPTFDNLIGRFRKLRFKRIESYTFQVPRSKKKIHMIFGGKLGVFVGIFLATCFIPLPIPVHTVIAAVFFGAVGIVQVILWLAGRKGFYSRNSEGFKIALDRDAFLKQEKKGETK